MRLIIETDEEVSTEVREPTEGQVQSVQAPAGLQQSAPTETVPSEAVPPERTIAAPSEFRGSGLLESGLGSATGSGQLPLDSQF